MNGVRLGTFQTLVNVGFTKPKGSQPKQQQGQDRSDFGRSVLAGALGGALGGLVASPVR